MNILKLLICLNLNLGLFLVLKPASSILASEFHLSIHYGLGNGTLSLNQDNKLEASAASFVLEYDYYLWGNFFAGWSGTYIQSPIEYEVGTIKYSGSYRAYTTGLGLGLNISDYQFIVQQEYSLISNLNVKFQSSSTINESIYRNAVLKIYQGEKATLLRISFIRQFRYAKKTSIGMLKVGLAMEKLVQPISIEAVQTISSGGNSISRERYKRDVDYSFYYDIISIVVGVFI